MVCMDGEEKYGMGKMCHKINFAIFQTRKFLSFYFLSFLIQCCTCVRIKTNSDALRAKCSRRRFFVCQSLRIKMVPTFEYKMETCLHFSNVIIALCAALRRFSQFELSTFRNVYFLTFHFTFLTSFVEARHA